MIRQKAGVVIGVALGLLAMGAAAHAGVLLNEEFNGTKLDSGKWTADSYQGYHAVHDGQLDMGCNGHSHHAEIISRGNNFDPFGGKLTVELDLKPEDSVMMHDFDTKYAGVVGELVLMTGNDYSERGESISLTFGARTQNGGEVDYWFINAGTGVLKISGLPTKITWAVEGSDCVVTLEGATFLSDGAASHHCWYTWADAEDYKGHARLMLAITTKPVVEGKIAVKGLSVSAAPKSGS